MRPGSRQCRSAQAERQPERGEEFGLVPTTEHPVGVRALGGDTHLDTAVFLALLPACVA